MEEESGMAFTLPDLPYSKSALEPYLSAETLEFHHDKHHQAYINNLNGLLDGSEMASKSLEEIVQASEGSILNNAAQSWNHEFYWHCMTPGGGGGPSGEVLKAIEKDFGSFEAFKTEFAQAANTQFGSGWAWLVLDGGRLSVMKTSNADNPLKHGQKALLTVDVWEHAYYIDYRNQRPKYVEAFLSNLVDWDFVKKNLSGS
jgi:superoxide dismutase, Fe-Mn family